MTQTIPAVDYLVLGDEPHLVAQACAQCGALYFDRRNACAKCFATEFGTRPLATEGVLRAYTIVERGAKNGPFTSAVVELEGGGIVKANLLGVTDPEVIQPEMKVRLATFEASVDDDGTVVVAFGFEPIGA
ncbi:OB-fold domain-containing protein [Rhodococcus sp. A14]|uniref:zinc ribbon domain-containing protein n=1 Tax=Rhodococcus sp. A14 TaxID=1194106 RepID=UPI001421D82E|nr:hypothetical protein [Rhodococcus sp. A14]